MKKYLVIFLSLCLLCALAAGCSGKSDVSKKPNEIDVDLTALSSTLVYAEVYNIMTTPGDYEGKTIKVGGLYQANYYEPTQQYYQCVIIADATACCQQGLEFLWSGKHKYPDDYPQDGTPIELTGVFESYEELGNTYYRLAVDEVTVLG